MPDVTRVEAIFVDALQQPAAGRAAFLDQACGNDDELRSRVERLLAAHGAAGGFLERPAISPIADATETHSPNGQQPTADHVDPGAGVGRVIAGKYKLLQQIGEGGMGSVWMADQTEPIKRRVAVKLIRVDRGNSQTILARFEAERQAIALMDHPHIAKLLDAGTTGEAHGQPSVGLGCPYFVMELVKGIPLTEFCDTHKLSIHERLGLFQQICSAVQHAHQKGIIHRDLNPGTSLSKATTANPCPRSSISGW